MEKTDKKAFNFIITSLVLIALALFISGLNVAFKIKTSWMILIILVAGIYFITFLIFLIKNSKQSSQQDRPFIVKEPTVEKIVAEAIEEEEPIEEIEEDEKEEPQNETKYIGSSKNKKYHLTTCRFAKGIGEKYKILSDSKSTYTKKKYTPCKTCKPNKN